MKKFILIFGFVPSLVFAQANGDSLKFEIIKETVNFFASDSSAYKGLRGKTLTCGKVDYSCISDYCTRNDVGSIQKKVDEWQKAPSATGDDLTNLVSKITTDLSNKEYRKKLDSFKKFKETVNQLASSFAEVPIEVFAETAEKDATKTVPAGVAELVERDMPNSESQLPLISLILSILALVTGGLALTRSSRGGSSVRIEKSKPNNKIILNDVENLKGAKQESGVDLAPIQTHISNLESRVLNLEIQPKVFEMPKINKNVISEPVQSQQITNSNKYARYPDMSNGFTNGALKDNQNGELIFEIQVSGSSASFCISSDPEAQVFALSDYKNYLSDACDFSNQPSKGCQIVTKSKGSLNRTGGNWIIQSKAKIEFRL